MKKKVCDNCALWTEAQNLKLRDCTYDEVRQ